jgi:hypothetical protein
MPLHFEGRLTARDAKRHIPHRFMVPANSGQLDIHFRYAPARVHDISNLITLTLFDSARFRGARHRDGDEHDVRINAVEATPGYLAGPLPAGLWTVEIDTHMIMPGQAVHYSLDISVGEGKEARAGGHPFRIETASPLTGRGVTRRGAGWYRGDLHSHTHHSDGEGFSVNALVKAANDEGLDFIFLTDHNTTAGLAEMDALSSEDLLTAGGIELTTFWGHALLLGTREWVDWRIRPGTGEMAHLASTAYARDQVFIIAHPQAIGDPVCTGCAWRYGDMMPGVARLVEIWNGPWKADSNNEQALALWYDWLNEGLHIVGTAGTDTHSAQFYATRPGFNVVYAEDLSETALLKALRAGHLYLSAGPQVDLQARTTNGQHWSMGDTITQEATFTVAWAQCPADAQLRLIANGRLLRQTTAASQGEYEWSMAPDQADWVVVEVRNSDGEMLAITNPIFLERTGS